MSSQWRPCQWSATRRWTVLRLTRTSGSGTQPQRERSSVAADTIPADERERQVPPEHHRGGRRPGRREPDDGLPCVVRQSPGRRHHEPARPRGDRRAWLSTEQPRPKSSPPTFPHDRSHRPRHHEPVLPGARTRRRRRAGRALPDVCVQHRRATRAGAALRGRGERPTGRRSHHRGVRFDGRRCPDAPRRRRAGRRPGSASAWPAPRLPSSPTTSTAVERRPATSSSAAIDGSGSSPAQRAPAPCARPDTTER